MILPCMLTQIPCLAGHCLRAPIIQMINIATHATHEILLPNRHITHDIIQEADECAEEQTQHAV